MQTIIRIQLFKHQLMSILSKSRLTALTASRPGYRTFSEVLNEVKNERRPLAETTIFLSHSHEDLKDGSVDKTIVFLRNLGIRIYIDSHDSSMPPLTNADTANKIKRAVTDNRKFIFLATNNSIKSRWCNWELGFGDAKKYINHIALFPLSEDSGSWQGNEYLRIYPRIEETTQGSNIYRVMYPDGKQLSVTDWLKLLN